MLDITIWGSRGSVPVSGEGFAIHGGSTTCVEVSFADARGSTPSRVIIDCGTGLAQLGKRWASRPKSAVVLQTHMHWDHIQGFPFFAPLYDPSARFEFFSVPRDGSSLREVLAEQMRRPNFPIGIDVMPADLVFGDLRPSGSMKLGEALVTWDDLCHPSGSTGFRISYRGATVVFSGDVEVREGSRDELVRLSRDADVLIMDAQYTNAEYPSRAGFGHSTPSDAVDVALDAGVKRLLLTHHDPSHEDVCLESKLREGRQWAHDRAPGRLRVENARDGLRLSLPTRLVVGDQAWAM